MRMLYKALAVFAAILATLLIAGCVPLQRAAAPASSPSASPAALQYDADPLAWLAQKANEGAAHETLNKEEAKRLTSLVSGVMDIRLFFRAGELRKADILWALYMNYHYVSYFDDAAGREAIYPGLDHPPDGAQTVSDYDVRAYIPAKDADTFMRNLIGTGIPDSAFDYGDPQKDERVICKDGIYYIYPGDPEYYDLRLRAYQPLGDGVFYLSFDGDDSGMPGPEESKHGNTPDYCRLLVVRSDSAWGFTVKAKLKEGDDSLLPADFPLPLYAA